MGTDKVRENRLRRMAARQELRLVKSRRRDPRALDFGTYGLADRDGGRVQVFAAEHVGTNELGRVDLSLDEIEAWLAGDPTSPPQSRRMRAVEAELDEWKARGVPGDGIRAAREAVLAKDA